MAGRDLALVQQQRNQVKQLVEGYRGDLTRVMPKHTNAEAFIGLALAYVRRDDKLREAAFVNPQSLILALRECAALGHMPVPKTFALVPFNDKNAPGRKAIVGIETYHGVIERMYRAGGVQSVHVEVGRDKDPVLKFNRTRMVLPDHEYDEHASPEERGPLKAVYAWARLIGGGVSQVAWLNRHDVARIRAMSKSATGEGGGNFWGPAWPGEGPNTEPMWKKSALHRLETFVPTSAEYRWQVAASESGAASGFRGLPDGGDVRSPDDGILDAEIVEDEPAAPAGGRDAAPPADGAEWADATTRRPPDAGAAS